MPRSNVDLIDNIDEVRRDEPEPIARSTKITRLTPGELRELAKILHEMLRRDLMLERDRMGR